MSEWIEWLDEWLSDWLNGLTYFELANLFCRSKSVTANGVRKHSGTQSESYSKPIEKGVEKWFRTPPKPKNNFLVFFSIRPPFCDKSLRDWPFLITFIRLIRWKTANPGTPPPGTDFGEWHVFVFRPNLRKTHLELWFGPGTNWPGTPQPEKYTLRRWNIQVRIFWLPSRIFQSARMPSSGGGVGSIVRTPILTTSGEVIWPPDFGSYSIAIRQHVHVTIRVTCLMSTRQLVNSDFMFDMWKCLRNESEMSWQNNLSYDWCQLFFSMWKCFRERVWNELAKQFEWLIKIFPELIWNEFMWI